MCTHIHFEASLCWREDLLMCITAFLGPWYQPVWLLEFGLGLGQKKPRVPTCSSIPEGSGEIGKIVNGTFLSKETLGSFRAFDLT